MRDNYWSFVKCMAIIAVVFIHTPYLSSNVYVGIVLRQFVAFGVALFVFLSGYFVKDDKLTWKRIRRLLIPYLVWSALWFAETTVTGSQPVSTWKIFNSIFLGGAFFPLYFLSVLIQLKLLTPLLYKRIHKNGYKWYKDWLWLITPIYVAGLYLWQIHTGEQPLVYAQIFPAWILFYYVGMYLKKCPPQITAMPIPIVLLLASLYLAIGEATFINDVLGIPFFAASQIKFTTFLYALIICVIAVNMHTRVQDSIFTRIGEASFGIYIIHIPIKMGVEKAMTYLPAAFQEGMLNQTVVVFVTVALCYLIVWVCDKVLPKKLVSYIGLK